MHHNPTAAQSAFGTLLDLALAFFRRSDGKWVDAVLGNTGATAPPDFNRAYNPTTDFHLGYVGNDTASSVVWAVLTHNTLLAVISLPQVQPAFFAGEASLRSGVYYRSSSNGNDFDYYSYLNDPRYIYHHDLGYEFVFDAADGKGGVYLYYFKSNAFLYTSPIFRFPYLYDFSLNSVVYYYPDPSNAGHYNTDGYRFDTGEIFVQ